MSDTYQQLIEHTVKASTFGSCASLIGWDEQTYLPPNGNEHRANQLGLLAGMLHEMHTAPQVGEWLSELEANPPFEPGSPEAANIRELRRSYDRSTKLPRRLVEELSRGTTRAQHTWKEARKADDFSLFAPSLKTIVDLKREEAQAIGFGDGVAYDALLDDYEPGATTAEVQAVFAPLRDALVEMVQKIQNSDRQPEHDLLERRYPVEAQSRIGRRAAEAIGFDFDSGRLDIAAHPFCSGIGPGDCRLTTRYDEHHFPGAFFGTLHEAGHGIYEQGLDPEAFGTPLGTSCSLGIHESQSRMWENFVGRGEAFWQHFWPIAQEAFPEALGDVTRERFHRAINGVRPSLIRVEADEVTYNLHIMLRFELEQALISGDLASDDVAGAWRETFEKYLGIPVPNDADGCLQDIHWSAGLFGYFPTYALGNLYAAQLFNAAGDDLGDLNEMFAQGEFLPLKSWLNEKVHQPGKRYAAPDLIEHVTGNRPSADPLIAHLTHRFGTLYNF